MFRLPYSDFKRLTRWNYGHDFLTTHKYSIFSSINHTQINFVKCKNEMKKLETIPISIEHMTHIYIRRHKR